MRLDVKGSEADDESRNAPMVTGFYRHDGHQRRPAVRPSSRPAGPQPKQDQATSSTLGGNPAPMIAQGSKTYSTSGSVRVSLVFFRLRNRSTTEGAETPKPGGEVSRYTSSIPARSIRGLPPQVLSSRLELI